MKHDRPKVRLGDVAEILTGHPFRSADFIDDISAPRLCRGDNVAQGRLRWESAKHWPLAKTTELNACWLRADDVILAMDRPWIEAGLKFAAVTQDDLPALLVQRVARLRGTSRLDIRFLRYLIASRDFTNYILAVQTGTAVPHISANQIRAYEFALPGILEQKRIVEVLCVLDKKIESNRQTNETLEAMARALFKSWFVDFDPVRARMEGRPPVCMDADTAAIFPDSFYDVDGSLLPKGWSTMGLDEEVSFLNGLALQKFPAAKADPFLPVIKITQLRAGNSEGADRASLSVPASHRIDDGDLRADPKTPSYHAATWSAISAHAS